MSTREQDFSESENVEQGGRVKSDVKKDHDSRVVGRLLIPGLDLKTARHGVSLNLGNGRPKFARSIFYRDACECLVSRELEHQLEGLGKNELLAIVTHWLQSMDRPPLVLESSVRERWRTTLSVRAGTEAPEDLGPTKLKVPYVIDFRTLPFPPVANPRFTFIDLFAGIGGFRIALQHLGGKCLFSSERDKHARETYYNNFGEFPFGDIRNFTGGKVSDEETSGLIPDHDILTAGFPCQPFSLAGVSSRRALGQREGFSCSIQGTLFFDVARIVKIKKPKVLILENVKNLLWHNKGRTFEKIKKVIEDDLGYSFSSDIIDASSLVPQRRQRCYMVCYRDSDIKFSFPSINGPAIPLSSILEPSPDQRYTISDRLWDGHKRRTRKNIKRGTGFTAFLADTTKPAKTLVARYYKDGKECLIPQSKGNPRKLTPRECARLQGFPEEFIPSSIDPRAYRQFGNSVPIPVVETIAERILDDMKNIR